MFPSVAGTSANNRDATAKPRPAPGRFVFRTWAALKRSLIAFKGARAEGIFHIESFAKVDRNIDLSPQIGPLMVNGLQRTRWRRTVYTLGLFTCSRFHEFAKLFSLTTRPKFRTIGRFRGTPKPLPFCSGRSEERRLSGRPSLWPLQKR